MNSITEKQRETPVCDKCQVLVAGGGIAGVSAAIAAARTGADVLLVEREYGLGGLATLGLIAIYLPICDGEGNQAQYGIVEELLHLSIKHGAEKGRPDAWLDGGTKEERKQKRFSVQYNPVLFALELEKLLRGLGVRVLYGTSIVGAEVENGGLKHVIIENRSGRSAIEVKTAVDATGEALLCKAAGCEVLPFKANNALASWYYSNSRSGYDLHMFGLADVIPEKGQSTGRDEKTSATRIGSRRYDGLDAADTSAMMMDAHEEMYKDIMRRREDDDTFVPTAMSTIPLLRMTGKLRGEYTLDDTEIKKSFADSVGLVSDWRKRGPVYEVPFGTLYSKKVKNLLAAGRTISVTDAMWDITRVIPPAAVTGQAAGTAAAMFSDMTQADIPALQARLREDGVKIHWGEINVSD